MSAGNIYYLQNKNIDKQKWDECISNAANGLIYGYSFYLDAFATHWNAIILNDYEAVMPLPWRKKFGIHYIYQPFLTAQLGVFGNKISKELLEEFLSAIPQKFKLWEFSLNHQNVFTLKSNSLYQRTNYILDLHPSYEELYKNYRENIKRNIKKAVQYNCIVQKDIEVQSIIDLVKQQTNSGGNDEDYKNLLQLYNVLRKEENAISYGVFLNDQLLASCVFFFSHNRAYYILVGNHPNGRTLGASHLLIDAFIKDHAGKNILLDFEGSDIRNLAFFYSSFGAVEEKFAAIHHNRLPFYLKWLKR